MSIDVFLLLGGIKNVGGECGPAESRRLGLVSSSRKKIIVAFQLKLATCHILTTLSTSRVSAESGTVPLQEEVLPPAGGRWGLSSVVD